MIIGICDDDAIARRKIHNFCEELLPKYCTDFEIKEFVNGEQLKGSKLDVLLLDVEMPGLDGMQIKKMLFEAEKNQIKRTVIIFVTEHEDRILGSHDLNVVGFVNKSGMKDQLPPILKFAIERSGTGCVIDDWNIDDIMYIKAADGYSVLYKFNGDFFSHRESIANLEETLLHAGYVRISRSVLVNMRYIRKISRNKIEWIGYQLEEKKDEEKMKKKLEAITISVRLESKVKKYFDAYCKEQARYC